MSTTTTLCQVRPSVPRSASSKSRSTNDSPRPPTFGRDRRRQTSLSSSPKPRNIPPPRRQSNRVRKQSAASSRSSSPPHAPQTSPVVTTYSNRRAKSPSKVAYTVPLSADAGPVANWDSVTYVVSDQKIESTYSKERQVPADGPKVYGKLVTKTVTMTVTTTIATTEIVHPDEGAAYIEALERQRRADPQAEKVYVAARQEAAGMRDLHEQFHREHHRTATPAVISSSA